MSELLALHQLTVSGVKCVILALTTMLIRQGQRIKTDARAAHMIAQCLSYGGYHPIYIPTEEEDSVKEYLRLLLVESAGGICKGAVGHKIKGTTAVPTGEFRRGDILRRQGKRKNEEQVLPSDKT